MECAVRTCVGRGVSGHRRDSSKFKASHKHGRGRDAAPAVEFPTGSKEFDLRAEGDVENHLGGAAIELLRSLKKRALAEILAVGEPQRETSRDSCSICSVTVRVQKKVRETVSEMSSGAPSPFDSSRVSAGMRENSRAQWSSLPVSARVNTRRWEGWRSAPPEKTAAQKIRLTPRRRYCRRQGNARASGAWLQLPCRGLVRVARSAWIGILYCRSCLA